MDRGSFLVVACVLLVAIALFQRGKRLQRDLGSLGSPQSIPSFYLGSIANCFRTNDRLQAICSKNGRRPFVFPVMGQSIVVPNSQEHIAEFCKAPEEILSMETAVDEFLQLRHIVGTQFCDETYHIAAIRTCLNRNLGEVLPDMTDEMMHAFHDILETRMANSKEGWTAVNPKDLFSRIICRTSNRVFVGIPLCRNEDYCNLVIDFPSDVLGFGPFVNFLVPPLFRPAVGTLYKAIFGHQKRMLRYLRPLIEARKRAAVATKFQEEKRNDMISWLMTVASRLGGRSEESLAMRMLNVNYVAIHTTTTLFVHALFHLAARPEYQDILRTEIETYLGVSEPRLWTREGLACCVKLDSFLKETLRLNGHGALWMPRVSVKDFTFSDGTRVPAGHFLGLPARPVHHDPEIYEQPEEFDGLRFSAMYDRKLYGDDAERNDWGVDEHVNINGRDDMTTASPSFLAFGGGRHVCPGRFFASLELKCLLAYLLFRFDVKMEQEGVRPPDEWFGPMASPASNVAVLIRRRIL